LDQDDRVFSILRVITMGEIYIVEKIKIYIRTLFYPVIPVLLVIYLWILWRKNKS